MLSISLWDVLADLIVLDWLDFLHLWDFRRYLWLFNLDSSFLSLLNFLLGLFLGIVDLIKFALADLLDQLELLNGHIIFQVLNQVDIFLQEQVDVFLWISLTFHFGEIQ